MSSKFVPLLILLLWLCCFPRPSSPNPRATEVALVCSNRTAPLAVRPTFVSNFLAALDAVTPLVAAQGYASVVNGTGATAVYAFGECMKDLSRSDCSLCFAQCKTQVLRCLPFQLGTTGGRIFYDGCYLRYDDYSFFNESVGAKDRAVCGNQTVAGDGPVFRANAAGLVRDLSVEAPKRDGFAVGFVNRGNSSVYGLAQCWEFVTGRGCESCLADAVSEIGSCMDKGEGRVLNAGCYLRYSPLKFYDNSTDDATGRSKGHQRSRVILPVCSSVLAFALMVGAVVLFMKKKNLKKRERKQLGSLLATVNKSKLNFSYETLEKATNYFHSSNKLGQGGSGSVYKGVLPDGDTVAIKRLFFNTRQWADHFFNEVNLISGIDHKNLVRLLGCSITGPESLLVYEYVSNQSLHDHLLGRKNIQRLSWEVRCNIILGTAEGLSYLHEDSHLRIIHRDIKLSNILLDEDFSAKIADFGLARFFPEDKTHISTAVAGTLGYMAPEYVVCGRLTEKADVYSFGVLVIEVISGKRNSSFTQDSFSVLQMVWNHYGTGRLGEAVDPALEGNFNEDEASRLLQIGLICAQASAELRPSMSVVVKMLTDGDEIPKPAQPPFLNPSCVENNILPRNNNSQHNSNSQSSGNSTTQSWIEPR